MDVFEVATPGSAPSGSAEPPVEAKHTGPLEGTSDDAVSSLAQEIFLSQAKMMEAIDSLTVRVESLARVVDRGAGAVMGQSPVGTDPGLSHHLGLIETRLGELTAASRAHREAAAAAAAAPLKDDSESFKHLVQLQDRLMVELKSVSRKLDNSNVSLNLVAPPGGSFCLASLSLWLTWSTCSLVVRASRRRRWRRCRRGRPRRSSCSSG